jgi:Domain of unknown function (DUF4440)
MICCLLCALMLAAVERARADSDVDTLVAIMSVEQTWLKSEVTNNPDLIGPLLADNIVDTTVEGKLLTGKEAVIADAKTVKWSQAEYQNIQIAVHGDTAIATAIFNGKGADTAGKPVDVHEQFTDVWVRMSSGQWQCVATHGTLIKM